MRSPNERTHLSHYDHLLVRRLVYMGDDNPAANAIFDAAYDKLCGKLVTQALWGEVLADLDENQQTFGEFRRENGIENRRVS